MKIAFLTLGCKVNYYETEKMMEQFRNRGYEICEFTDQADIYVINTCTVTNMADRKSRQMIHRAKKKNPDSLVVAVGCYVESGGEKLLEDASIDAAFSNGEKEQLAELIIQRFDLHAQGKETGVERLKNARTRAYLKVQDGCNQFCTYCMIPYVRGGGILKSTEPEVVLQEVKQLAERGYKEVVLTGIHLSSYGVDRSETKNFVKLEGKPLLSLIRETAAVPGIRRVRLGSLEPRIITGEFLRELADIPEFCPHFHLSLQSGCETVLKRMNRHYTPEEYREKVEMIREVFEHPAVTTDVIVGFPGETDEEFEATRMFLQNIQLADIHVFPYSPRSGTKAAAMKGQVTSEKKKERSELLIEDTKGYQKRFGEYFLGKEENVLFEDTAVENGKTYLCGHNERYVMIGIPQEEALEKGYKSGEIATVTVGKILAGNAP
ncbi:MAG: tRNA (N(6)-L-threonylcarbamoyladenosine(37)-C(2))-methylthiotransferase MtaB [Eubacterium sp.]|nr:tRNA (N(6)-L-threonylcarbamoyladenosine(37)-C(2))-methylthiotransferase MtaB [Eubacterium sp.]